MSNVTASQSVFVIPLRELSYLCFHFLIYSINNPHIAFVCGLLIDLLMSHNDRLFNIYYQLNEIKRYYQPIIIMTEEFLHSCCCVMFIADNFPSNKNPNRKRATFPLYVVQP